MSYVCIGKLFLLCLIFINGLFYSVNSFAIEVIAHNAGPTVNERSSIKKVEPVYPIATANDVMCGKSHHMVRFRSNDTHAGLSFSLAAKKMTRVKIRWDHPDKVLFPNNADKKTIVFPHAGGVARLYFRAFHPVSGNLYVINDHGAVVKVCPYSFLPAKHYRQSIGLNLNDTQYQNNDLNTESNNVSINYSISSRNVVPGGGNWSFSLGLSQSESSADSRQVNSSLRYSW